MYIHVIIELGDNMITRIDLPGGLGRLEYGRGKFDDFCVFYVNEKLERYAPKDQDTFIILKELIEIYDAEEVYNDFVSIYKLVKKEIKKEDVLYIETMKQKYGTKAVIAFLILYMTMISEQNKKNTELGKRIKRLGVHVLLLENKSIEESAHFMDNMNSLEIDKLCRERGF